MYGGVKMLSGAVDGKNAASRNEMFIFKFNIETARRDSFRR